MLFIIYFQTFELCLSRAICHFLCRSSWLCLSKAFGLFLSRTFELFFFLSKSSWTISFLKLFDKITLEAFEQVFKELFIYFFPEAHSPCLSRASFLSASSFLSRSSCTIPASSTGSLSKDTGVVKRGKDEPMFSHDPAAILSSLAKSGP